MKSINNPTTIRPGRWFQARALALAAGLALAAVPALAQSFYTNSTGDFNVANSWSPNGVPSGSGNATDDNGSNNVVLIQAGDPAWLHGDTLAGQTSGTSGAYLQTGSTNDTGYPSFGNWLRLGIGVGSAGWYVLSNGVLNVAGQTHLGEKGYGYLEIDNGVYNTGYNGNPGICAGDGDFGVSSGTLVINGGAVTNVNNETWFGEGNNCTGYLYMNGGVLRVNNWFVFGRGGGSGFGVMTNGTLTMTGGGQFLIGGGGVGSLAQSGGAINVYDQYLVPQNNGSGAGAGTNMLSGSAVLNVHDWLAVGRSGGYGELDISGNAVINRDDSNNNPSHFDIGASAKGVVNQNGGVIRESTSDVWLGESGSGTWNVNGGSAYVQNLVLCVNSSASAQLNLNGGLFQAAGINSYTSGNVSLLNLNGGTLQANANNTTFISGLFQATVGAGGVTIDSQGFNITIPQALSDAGGGTLAKIGSGTLTLSGANSYAGATAVNAGTLAVTTASTGGGTYSVAGGAALNVQVVGSLNSQLNLSGLAFAGPATTLTVDLNNFGSPSSAPVNVNGPLTVNGAVTINILDSLAQIGEFPLISYSSKTGSSYVLGSLPIGVAGHLVDNTVNNSIDLAITSVNQPRWDGNAGGNWDIGLTTNWVNLGTGLPTYYSQGNTVLFDDNATGTTSVNLVANVTPGGLTIDNDTLVYTLSGNGGINGAIGLLKEGASSFAVQTTNAYTGPTTIAGGALIVNNLANGGLPSAIGASSANATNLVLANGTLSYTGPAVAINRSYMLENTNCVIDTESNLTLSGTVASVSDADFVKSGPAQLTYATVGVNALSGTTSLGFRTIAGATAFVGSAGGQTNNVLGHFGVGGLGGTNATVVLTNATLNVPTGGVDLGRSGGATGTLDLYDGAVMNSLAGNFALGDGGGMVSTGVVNQAGGVLNISGPQMFVGQNNAGVGIYNLSAGTLSINNWLAAGRQGGYGVINLSGTGTIVKTGGGNIDIGTSGGVAGYAGTGILNQSGGALTNTASQTWFGEGSSGEPVSGTWIMTGGTATLGEVHIGLGGIGTNLVDITGPASVNCAGYVDIAQDATVATVNIGSNSQPGGSLTAQGDLTVADNGTATLNLVANGAGMLTVQGTMYLSRNSATALGTVNLNSGATILAGYINNGWGFGHGISNNPQAFNFNGGTLRAFVGSPYFIQPFVNAVVQGGGAIIDDNGFAITVLAGLVNGGGNGGLTKLGNGTLFLNGANTYTGMTLVNAGTVAGLGSIAGPVTVAAGGTLAAGWGTMGNLVINNSLTFAGGSTSMMKIGASSSDQITGLTGVAYNGALVVTNVSGASLTVGQTYNLFSAASAGSGNFTSVTILPAGAGTFNPATGVLTITSAGGGSVTVNSVTVQSGNLVLTGTGTANAGYTLLTTTNLATPIANWTTNFTGSVNASGVFSNAVPINPSQPAAFFRVRTP